MKITLEQKHVRAAAVAVGMWLVLGGAGFYLLGKQHGSKVDCSVEESLIHECQAQLAECRADIEEARIKAISSEAKKCKETLDEYKALRCKLCAAGVP
jgi:hypothetical protein